MRSPYRPLSMFLLCSALASFSAGLAFAQATPTITNVTNAANSTDMFPPLAPGQVAAITGANLADTTASAAPPQTLLGGVEVRFVSSNSEFLATLLYVSPTSISFVVPYILNSEVGSTSITIVKAGKRFAELTRPGAVTVGAVGFESSPNPALYDQPVTFTAHVAVLQGYPGSALNTSGAVTFMDGDTPLALVKLGDVLTYVERPPSRLYDVPFTTSKLEAGEHAIWVRYSGDNSNKPGISGTIPQIVKKPEITIWSSPNPSLLGHSVALVATFFPSTCAGSVTFFDEKDELGTAKIERGRALLLTSEIPLGNHPLTVRYQGDGTCAPLVYGPANDYVYRTTSQTVY